MISLCTAGKHQLMQRRHRLALCPRQMLPRRAAAACRTCPDGAGQGGAGGTRGERRLPEEQGQRAAVATACGRGCESSVCLPKGQVWGVRGPLIHCKEKRLLRSALSAPAKEGQGKKKVISVIGWEKKKKSQHSREKVLEQQHPAPELESCQRCPCSYYWCNWERSSPAHQGWAEGRPLMPGAASSLRHTALPGQAAAKPSTALPPAPAPPAPGRRR